MPYIFNCIEAVKLILNSTLTARLLLTWISWMSLDPTLTRSAIHLKLGNFLIPLYMHAYILNLCTRIRVSLYHDDDDDDDDNFQTALLSFL